MDAIIVHFVAHGAVVAKCFLTVANGAAIITYGLQHTLAVIEPLRQRRRIQRYSK